MGLAAFYATQGEHFDLQVTVCYLNNAARGVVGPLQVIHKAATISRFTALNLPEENCIVGVTPSGYQSKETLLSLIIELVELVKVERGKGDTRWHLLALDGHFSREDSELMDLLVITKIQPFFICSHQSHKQQPADMRCQKRLRALLRVTLHDVMHKLSYQRLSIPLINSVLAKAWPKFVAGSIEMCAGAWSDAGLFPFKEADEVQRTSNELLLLHNSGAGVSLEELLAAPQDAKKEGKKAKRAREEAEAAGVAAEAAQPARARARLEQQHKEEMCASVAALRARQKAEIDALLRGEALGGVVGGEAGAQQPEQDPERSSAPSPGGGSQGSASHDLGGGGNDGGGSSNGGSGGSGDNGVAPGSTQTPAQVVRQLAGAMVAGAGASPHQLFAPALTGKFTMRAIVVASIASKRGLTDEQQAEERKKEQAAKRIKLTDDQRGCTGLYLRKGCIVTSALRQMFRENEEKAQKAEDEKLAAQAARQAAEIEKRDKLREEGADLWNSPAWMAVRARGADEALFKHALGQLTKAGLMSLLALHTTTTKGFGGMKKPELLEKAKIAVQRVLSGAAPAAEDEAADDLVGADDSDESDDEEDGGDDGL